MNTQVKYQPLPNPSDMGEKPLSPRWKHRSALAFIGGGITAMILMATAFAGHSALSIPKTLAELEDQDWNYCGRSSDAARARGCVMEPMFYGWMPPQCVYQELTQSLPVFEDRTYYSDENMTQALSPEQLWAGEHTVIYTSRYHDQHCLFQWRKLHYAMNNHMEFVDNKTVSMGHATHCANQLTEQCEPQEGGVNLVELGFYKCRKTIW
ncbi:hypothetical protein F4780DRAFT_777141 [Xylariomycetidae sp. FL0641]|nr:hypothetical protein F4780DRAFT_777141 [Xylariomycetidae sp. FL0641]